MDSSSSCSININVIIIVNIIITRISHIIVILDPPWPGPAYIFWAEPPPWGEAPSNIDLVMSVHELVHLKP